MFRRALRRDLRRRPPLAGPRCPDRQHLRLGPGIHLRAPPTPTWTACQPRRPRSATSSGRVSWSSWATPSPPTTSPGRGDPLRQRGRPLPGQPGRAATPAQHLRLPPRQPRGHGARRLRQRPAPQPARPRDRRWVTRCFDAGDAVVSIYQAARTYQEHDTPVGHRRQGLWRWVLPRLGGQGPKLLGVRAILAESFERIHRSNLIGMGILPLQFLPGQPGPVARPDWRGNHHHPRARVRRGRPHPTPGRGPRRRDHLLDARALRHPP